MAGTEHQEGRRNGDAIPADMVMSELSRTLGSRYFAKSGRLTAFLRYVVETTLNGKGNEIKEYLIAVDVFGKPESFDPRLDTLVRVQASKLRAKLKEYYGTDGAKDEVIIELPRGSYVPTFQLGASPQTTPSTAVARTPRILTWLAVPAALLVLAGVIWSIYRFAREPDTVTSNPKSIAILPFTDMSPEKNQEYFCDGMTEEITSALSKSRIFTSSPAHRRLPLKENRKTSGVSATN
ncbi:MAG: hypothetical protein M3Y27_16105 [Acidobacteriota bacterium]|nr:hypothetical protein [Acidobacteriota bacterium]